MKTNRIFLIVLDSFGIGELPDAAEFGDTGSNTLLSVSQSSEFRVPELEALGLFHIDGVCTQKEKGTPMASFARMAEQSKGKDTTIGHWEISGIVTENPLPVYPNGFPKSVIDEFEQKTGKKTICNKPYSGTKVILEYGKEQIETGALIVYTSADSVFQIAAHEEIVPVEQLYQYCETARAMLTGENAVGRVIARPFTGEYPNFTRTQNRRDFSLEPIGTTVLDCLKEAGLDVLSVGKIWDIFTGKGITKRYVAHNNAEGMAAVFEAQKSEFHGLCFINLVDFDMLYGHRNDVDGYARALHEFDEQLKLFLKNMRSDDVLIITADHGCDPATESTDHSREYIPMLIYGETVKHGVNLKTRDCFCDIAATIADVFEIDRFAEKINGTSFWSEVHKEIEDNI
jgi:phosphopentomutase